MSNKVTMQHVADAIGVSKYVVSKSLSGKEGVNAATRERVRQAAVKLGYRFNARSGAGTKPGAGGSDQSVLSGEKMTVVVMLPNIRHQFRDSLYWGRILDGITGELDTLGAGAVVITDQTVDSFLSIVHRDNIQGFIGVGEIAAKVLQEVGRLRVPIVLIDHEDLLVEASELFANNRECVYQLTNYLISLGHRAIRFVGNTRYSKSFQSRWSGYKDALEEHGIYVIADDPLASLEGSNRQEHAEEIKRVLAKDQSQQRFPSALVCANDAIAISAMDALRGMDVRVPEDVSITGFDNIEDSFHAVPKLTTVNVEKEILGRRAVQVLLGRIENPDFPTEIIYMSASLIHRESTAPMLAE
jgi:LacI family transcriptional regulator